MIVKIYFKSEKAFRHIEFYLSLTEGPKKRLGNRKFTLHYSSLYVDSIENQHSISLILTDLEPPVLLENRQLFSPQVKSFIFGNTGLAQKS